jgi:SAM-dependent methyltransferase
MSAPERASRIPYFDSLVTLVEDDEAFSQAFGRHVHWGYWDQPPPDIISLQSFVDASDRLTERVLEEAAPENGMRILDAGCGFGGTLEVLNQKLRDCTLIGINVEDRQLERARSLVRPANGNRVQFLQMDANSLGFTESFDIIIALESIFHFDRPRFFHCVHQILRNSGRLVITDFVLNPGMFPLFRILERLTRKATLATYGPIDLSYSTKRYAKLCKQTGLTMRTDRDITKNTSPTYRYVLPMAERVPDRVAAAHFKKATKSLQMATRAGIVGYHIMSYGHDAGDRDGRHGAAAD